MSIPFAVVHESGKLLTPLTQRESPSGWGVLAENFDHFYMLCIETPIEVLCVDETKLTAETDTNGLSHRTT